MIRIGLFGIGLETYWGQFDGLLERLMGYQEEIATQLSREKTEVINAGMVDTAQKAQEAAQLFRRSDIDCVFIFISTYALSQNTLPVIQKLNVPIFLLNLKPVKAIDYKKINALQDRGKMTGEWLAHCQSCVAPELVSVFNRTGVKFTLLSGYLQEAYIWRQINQYLKAVEVVAKLRVTRIGALGHYYNGMLDVYSDLTQLSGVFGCHFEILEFGQLKQLRESVTPQERDQKISEFENLFIVNEACSDYELERAALTAVALDKLVTNNDLGALAYYYEGAGDDRYQNIVTSLIPGFTVLTGKNIPVAGEYEIKNVLAMKIMDLLGSGGSFSEFYALDFDEDLVLLGHDGPAHFAIAQGKVGLVPLPVYHGKPGKGLSIQMEVASGPVTLLSVAQDKEGKVYFVCAEGEVVPGETLKIGNTNSRYKFPISVRQFIDSWSLAGPSHHCAIGTGHLKDQLLKIADLLNINCIQIC